MVRKVKLPPDSEGTAEQVPALFQTQYFDLNVRHFHEKLRAEHQIRDQLQSG